MALGASGLECAGLLPVGDAGSMVSPCTGEGVGCGVESRALAAAHLPAGRAVPG